MSKTLPILYVAGIVAMVTIIPPITLKPKLLSLTWNCNYLGRTDVETVIESTTNLLNPLWMVKFCGSTNRASFLETNNMEFFRASNKFINKP